MTAAQLAEHFPERIWIPVTTVEHTEDHIPTREVRCACGWACDAPESLTAKRWAEHALQRTEASA